MKRTICFLLLLTTLLFLCGCGQGSDPSAPESSASSEQTDSIGEETVSSVDGTVSDTETSASESEESEESAPEPDESSVSEESGEHVHEWDEGTISVPASCTAEGSVVFHCKGCEETKTETVPKTNHRWAETDCSKPHTCKDCGLTEDGSKGHDWIPADCTSPKTCSVCGQTEGEKLMHQYTETVVAPTKNSQGYTLHTCSLCGNSYKDNYTEYSADIGLSIRDNGDGTCVITGLGSCSLSDITVPQTIKGLTVVGVADGAFMNCPKIHSISFPFTVKFIGKRAFFAEDMTKTGLAKVTLPGGLESIGEEAFAGCLYLNGIALPDSIATIGKAAFSGAFCSLYDGRNDTHSYHTITLPKNLKIVSEALFEGCSFIGTVVMPNGLTEIGERAFDGCQNMTVCTIPSTVKTIGATAFANCSVMKAFAIPNGVKRIEQNAFTNCYALETISIPSTVNYFGDYCFDNCTALKAITIPSGTTYIGERAFGSCGKITSITLPDSLTTLGASALMDTGISQITIPAGITKLADGVLAGCPNLVKVRMSDNVTEFGESTFHACMKLNDINMPSKLSRIGDYCFYDTAFTSLTLPDGVTEIPESCFAFSALKTFTVGAKITKIGVGAFEKCENLTSLTFKTTSGWWEQNKSNPWEEVDTDWLVSDTDAAEYFTAWSMHRFEHR